MHVSIPVSPATQQGQYLIACARIRDVTMTHLVQQLVNVIAQDQLVGAVLDDEGRHQHARHEHRFREITK